MNCAVVTLCVAVALCCSQAQGGDSESDDFLIIAHRGASAYAPENTLAAFSKAVALGANVIEVDVRQTKDGRLVVMHDADVRRTTNGEGDVRDLTLRELKRLDAGSWFREEFRDERIPTLDEVVDLLPESVQIIIEIKGDSSIYPGIAKNVVGVIETRKIATRAILKSFDVDVLDRCRQLAPEIRQLFVYAVRIPFLDVVIGTEISMVDVFSLPVLYLQPHPLFLTDSFVEEAHEKGYKVIAWDINDESAMEEMIRKGISGIETDYPDVLRQVLASVRGNRK